MGSVLIWILTVVLAVSVVLVRDADALNAKDRVPSFVTMGRLVEANPARFMRGGVATQKVMVNDLPKDNNLIFTGQHEDTIAEKLLEHFAVEPRYPDRLPLNHYTVSYWAPGPVGSYRGKLFDVFDSRTANMSAQHDGWGSPPVLDANIEASHRAEDRLNDNQKPRAFGIDNSLSTQQRGGSVIIGRLSQSLELSGVMRQLVQRPLRVNDAEDSNTEQSHADPKSGVVVTILGGSMDDPYIGWNVLFMCGLEGCAVRLLLRNRNDWRGWLVAFGSLLCLVRLGVSLHREASQEERDIRQLLHHDGEIVYQKPLTLANLRFTVIDRGLVMANVLNTDKQIAVIGALAEGNSIRSIERMTGIHRDTIMRLGVKVGQGCTALMDDKMRNLPCTRLEMDEIWGYIGKKDRHVREGDDPQFGNVWTWCAIDADTKLVPAFRVGSRDHATAVAFVRDVASRMSNRVQVSTDGLNAYVDAIERAFGGDADYGQVIKTYGVETSIQPQRRYSQPEITGIEKKAISGRPNFDLISTSYVERLNATTRLHMKRLARLTHAFSKKRVNFEAAVGLHFAYYNFVKRHSTIRCTPAMAAGVTGTFWSVGDLLQAAA